MNDLRFSGSGPETHNGKAGFSTLEVRVDGNEASTTSTPTKGQLVGTVTEIKTEKKAQKAGDKPAPQQRQRVDYLAGLVSRVCKVKVGDRHLRPSSTTVFY